MSAPSTRFDLSSYLIHFFRKVDLDNNSAPVLPEVWGFESVVEDTVISPFFLLRCAVRQARLWATWAYRNDRRTIYGPHAAICFTEMPLAAFLESGAHRAEKGEAMSQYGLMFPKRKMFALGVRPVIYALSGIAKLPAGKDGGPRIIDPPLLPESEQYRYVPYSPDGRHVVDWTHEREWRWPFRGEMPDFSEERPESPDSMPGLELTNENCRGMGAVVKSRRQAELLAVDMLTLIDTGHVPKDRFSHILILEELASPADLRDPTATELAIRNATISFEQYFSGTREDQLAMIDSLKRFADEVEAATPMSEPGEPGGCWLCFSDNRNGLVRALVEMSEIIITGSGTYLFYLDQFRSARALRERQNMAVKLAERVQAEFGVSCSYYSVVGSTNPNGYAMFRGDILDDRPVFNYAHIEEDF